MRKTGKVETKSNQTNPCVSPGLSWAGFWVGPVCNRTMYRANSNNVTFLKKNRFCQLICNSTATVLVQELLCLKKKVIESRDSLNGSDKKEGAILIRGICI